VCKPYAAMISLQFGYAGMNILTKFSLNHGMSHYVLVVYRHAFATLSIAPFALILERYTKQYRLLFTLSPWNSQLLYSSVIGAVLIVVGLYSVLWGKHKENREKTTEANIPVSITGTQGDGQVMEIIELDEVDLEKAKSSNKVIDAADVAIIPVNASVPANLMKVNEEER
ncbi:hypothetical protein GW17_00006855, partial [Ensete ventricosum]